MLCAIPGILAKCTTFAALSMALIVPPAGRPPTGPLEREEPRVYDVEIEVSVKTYNRPAIDPVPETIYRLQDAPIMMPVILQGAYSRVDPESLGARLWLLENEDHSIQQRARLESGHALNTHLAILPVRQFAGTQLRWRLSYRVQVWSSRLDERAASRIPWPQDWPEEVREATQPQRFIESDDPIFINEVQQLTQGQLRSIPPLHAAKELIRHTLKNIQVVGPKVHMGELRTFRGLAVKGAKAAAASGEGSPHDLVCACVALLRAADIPARPVIGFRRDRDADYELFTWAEFYLPEAGWVPFDPDEMRSAGLHRDANEPWPHFGTFEDMNRWIPLAYHFIPPVKCEVPDHPAVWGWDPKPGGDPGSRQHIRFMYNSRSRGTPDPR